MRGLLKVFRIHLRAYHSIYNGNGCCYSDHCYCIGPCSCYSDYSVFCLYNSYSYFYDDRYYHNYPVCNDHYYSCRYYDACLEGSKLCDYHILVSQLYNQRRYPTVQPQCQSRKLFLGLREC